MGSSSRRTGVQQTAAESTLLTLLDKQSWPFTCWLFLGGVYTQECLRWFGFSQLNVIH